MGIVECFLSPAPINSSSFIVVYFYFRFPDCYLSSACIFNVQLTLYLPPSILHLFMLLVKLWTPLIVSLAEHISFYLLLVTCTLLIFTEQNRFIASTPQWKDTNFQFHSLYNSLVIVYVGVSVNLHLSACVKSKNAQGYMVWEKKKAYTVKLISMAKKHQRYIYTYCYCWALKEETNWILRRMNFRWCRLLCLWNKFSLSLNCQRRQAPKRLKFITHSAATERLITLWEKFPSW